MDMKVKVINKKVSEGKVIYTAIVEGQDEVAPVTVTGNFNAQFLTNYVELDMIDNIIQLHVTAKGLFKDLMEDFKYQDFSQLGRINKDLNKTFLGNKEFRAWFSHMMSMAKTIHNQKLDLYKPITKTSASGKIQMMPCYFYLAGIRKANVHYLQSDFGLKSSDYEREKIKEVEVKEWFEEAKKPVKVVAKKDKEVIKPKVKKEKVAKEVTVEPLTSAEMATAIVDAIQTVI